jgi:hypothetical protein
MPFAPTLDDFHLSPTFAVRESRLLRNEVAEDGKYNVVANKPTRTIKAAALREPAFLKVDTKRDWANIGLGG